MAQIKVQEKPQEGVKPKINLRYMRDKDREMVKGKFIFHEVPGGVLEFVFKKYKEDAVEKYTMYDGEIYTVPLGVAKHLNKDCWYPIHSFTQDENGKPTQKIGQKVRRCSFQSLEFVDIDDLTPEGSGLITVENVGA
jgi:hypothetical protein